MKQTFNPCDECDYSYSKNNQDSGMCKICEFNKELKLEKRLQAVYGKCDGLLEKVVEHLELHEGIDLPEPVFKARLLTDGNVDKWEEFKNLEEQGKLMKLPCAVGDTVYVIPSSQNFGINIVNRHEENNRVYEQIIDHVEIRRSGYLLSTCDGMACVIEKFYKETWFTDKKEAEVKLKKIERYWKKVFQ